jgi:hypothetical protein
MYEGQAKKENNYNLEMKTELLSCKADLPKSYGMLPMIKKETVKVSLIQMIGGAIVYILNIIVHQRHSVTC